MASQSDPPVVPVPDDKPLKDDKQAQDDESDEEGWQDVDQDDAEDSLAVISLLDDRVFPDALSMLEWCKEKYSFDFLAVRQRLGLDFYGTIKLINFIRQHVHEGRSLPDEITTASLEDDSYLKPVLDDDALILCLDDLPEPDTAASTETASGAATADGTTADTLQQRNAELEAQLEQLTRQFESYRETVEKTLDKRWNADDESDSDSDSGRSVDSAERKPRKKGKEVKKEEDPEEESRYYFESYAHNDIHETMLKDTIRTEAYRDFIYNNKHLFKDKVVLDIGCGTGILSMFCAKAGASLVIAVDKSEIIHKARENIFRNNLDSTITTLHGTIEQLTLPVDKVDIIVSEWMGYGLLYEAMLPSVIWARDRYLRPETGLLVPSHSNMWIAPVADREYIADHVNFWRDVYGFDMRAMQAGIYKDVRVEHWPTSSVCGAPAMFRCLDLHKTTKEDLVFAAKWKSALNADVDCIDGFLLWFDIYFATSQTAEPAVIEKTAEEWVGKSQEKVAFTTGPWGKETHWRQTVMLREEKEDVKPKALAKGYELSGEIDFAIPEDNARALVLKVDWVEGDEEADKHSQSWSLQ